jgi:SanA protein
MWKKYRKRILRFCLAVFLLMLVVLLYGNYTVRAISKGKTFVSLKDIPKNKVGMVLGTSKLGRNGNINLYFEYRIQATVRLFKAGKIEYVLVSGDNGNENYDEPTDFKNELVARGIPADLIFLDYAGFRTLDSVVRAREIFGQEKYTVISQKFHNDRAIYLATKKGMEVVGYNAKDVVKYGGIRTKVREVLARAKAFLDILFGVQPKFMGEKVRIF